MKSPRFGEAHAFRKGCATAPYREKGFTLLEVLVALGISIIVMTALYSSFFLSRKAVDAVDDSLLRLQESRALLDIIKREMESSLYDQRKIANGKAYTLFKLED